MGLLFLFGCGPAKAPTSWYTIFTICCMVVVLIGTRLSLFQYELWSPLLLFWWSLTCQMALFQLDFSSGAWAFLYVWNDHKRWGKEMILCSLQLFKLTSLSIITLLTSRLGVTLSNWLFYFVQKDQCHAESSVLICTEGVTHHNWKFKKFG